MTFISPGRHPKRPKPTGHVCWTGRIGGEYRVKGMLWQCNGYQTWGPCKRWWRYETDWYRINFIHAHLIKWWRRK